MADCMIDDVISNSTNEDLLRSMLAESAKASNELKCARRDLDKAESRLSFVLMILNNMINRTGDKQS